MIKPIIQCPLYDEQTSKCTSVLQGEKKDAKAVCTNEGYKECPIYCAMRKLGTTKHFP